MGNTLKIVFENVSDEVKFINSDTGESIAVEKENGVYVLNTEKGMKITAFTEEGEISQSKDKTGFDATTTIGAIEYIVATVYEKWNCPVVFYTGTYFKNEIYQKMVDALLKLGKKWNFGIIDLWNDPEMRAVKVEDYKKYMGDVVHPTILGYKEWWGPKFIEFSKNNI